MIEPVGEAIPSMVHPPAEAPDSQKPRKAEEEQKFAHQLEQLVVKEQQEAEAAKKVGDEEPKKREEKKRGKNEKRKENHHQQIAGDSEVESRKGHILDTVA